MGSFFRTVAILLLLVAQVGWILFNQAPEAPTSEITESLDSDDLDSTEDFALVQFGEIHVPRIHGIARSERLLEPAQHIPEVFERPPLVKFI